MDHANEAHAVHANAVAGLRGRLDEARTFEASRKNNDDAIAMWDQMLDPAGSLLGGFLSHWQARQRVSTAFIPEKKTFIGKAFDEIIQATTPAN